MSTWSNIKDAMTEMLEDNNFTVYNCKEISRRANQYIVVSTDGEQNRDVNNYVGSCQYRNRRIAVLYVYNKTQQGITDIDRIKEAAKEEMEEVLDTLKGIFNSTYNKIGDAGAFLCKYEGMRFKDTSTEGIYAPVRMEVRYLIDYTEDRRISPNSETIT